MNVSLQNIDKVSAQLTVKPVSYTHLDVYKRQVLRNSGRVGSRRF